MVFWLGGDYVARPGSRRTATYLRRTTVGFAAGLGVAGGVLGFVAAGIAGVCATGTPCLTASAWARGAIGFGGAGVAAGFGSAGFRSAGFEAGVAVGAGVAGVLDAGGVLVVRAGAGVGVGVGVPRASAVPADSPNSTSERTTRLQAFRMFALSSIPPTRASPFRVFGGEDHSNE
jgi:hypothetical protein